MNVYQQYLDQNNITRYRVSKISGVSANTLQHAVDSKTGTDGISGRILKATGKALNKEPWDVLRELIELEDQQDEKMETR